MFQTLKSLTGRTLANPKAMLAAGAIALATTTGSALAVDPYVPTDVGDIVFALTPESIAVGVGTAGATMLGLWAVWAIGFKLLRKFIRRMGSTV
jgi:hypothetical protein